LGHVGFSKCAVKIAENIFIHLFLFTLSAGWSSIEKPTVEALEPLLTRTVFNMIGQAFWLI